MVRKTHLKMQEEDWSGIENWDFVIFNIVYALNSIIHTLHHYSTLGIHTHTYINLIVKNAYDSLQGLSSIRTRVPWKQDVSVLVKHCSNDSYSSPDAWLVFFSIGLVVMVWDCLVVCRRYLDFIWLRWKDWDCFCFSITAFLEESLWFYSLEYPELEKRMIFLSLTSSCFSRLAPACTFFFLVLHISTSVHIFCLAFFFPLSFTRKWQCTLPSQQEVVCLAESILSFLSIKLG